MYEVALIQSAGEWHVHGLKARRWLRVAFDDLSHDQRLAYSRESARAFTERDRILKQLGLDRIDENNVIDVLYQAIDADESEPENTDDPNSA